MVIRVLRLFNLCEIGPTVSKMQSGDLDELAAPPRPPSAGPQRSDGSAGSMQPAVSASDLRALRPLSRNESGSSLAQQAPPAPSAEQREEGEVTPEPERSAADQRLTRQQHHNLQPPQPPPAGTGTLGGPGSPGKEQRARAAAAAARVRAAWDEAQRSGQLSSRQAARIADMSLLLEVVLKTNTLRWAVAAPSVHPTSPSFPWCSQRLRGKSAWHGTILQPSCSAPSTLLRWLVPRKKS